MAFQEVVGYWAEWNLQHHVGKIWVKTNDDRVTVTDLESPQEFSAVIDLLRNEGPHGFDHYTRQLQTTLEAPGEHQPK
jgi:hypothetical protein